MNSNRIQRRAEDFAGRVRNLGRFLVVDKVTLELYGYKKFVVNTAQLKAYYEHHEPNPADRDWETFLAAIEREVEWLLLPSR